MGSIIIMVFKSRLLNFITIFGFLGICQASEDGCCSMKSVGGIKYNLMENAGVEVPENCMSQCIYEQEGNPNSRFCFARGSLPVECISRARLLNIESKLDISGTYFLAIDCLQTQTATQFQIPPNVHNVDIGIKQVCKITAGPQSGQGAQCTPYDTNVSLPNVFDFEIISTGVGQCAVQPKSNRK